VAFAALRRQFGSFLRHVPGARLGEDPEEVHDLRVATRRIRAVLREFADALPARAGRFRDEFKWVAAALGAVRDLDVPLEWLGPWADDPAGGPAASGVVGVVEEQLGHARSELLSLLDSPRYARLTAGFEALIRRGPLRAQPIAWRPMGEAAPDLVDKRRRATR